MVYSSLNITGLPQLLPTSPHAHPLPQFCLPITPVSAHSPALLWLPKHLCIGIGVDTAFPSVSVGLTPTAVEVSSRRERVTCEGCCSLGQPAALAWRSVCWLGEEAIVLPRCSLATWDLARVVPACHIRLWPQSAVSSERTAVVGSRHLPQVAC